MDVVGLVILVTKVLVAFGFLLVSTLLLIWMERKIVADMQSRVGPARAGPFGILQTLADGIKLFFKEQITPRTVELGVYLAAPVVALLPAFLTFLVVPVGRPITVGERTVALQVMDLNVAVLYVLAMSSVAVYAVVLAGWSSGSKYPMLGGVRSTAQMISYEAAMGLALIPLVMTAGTASLAEIVELQAGTYLGFVPRWFVIPQAIPFVLFFVAGVAETNRAPFDLVEAEQELVGGFHTEYSGVRFAMFFLAEYVNIINISAIAVTLFLGGYQGPTFDGLLPAFVSSLLPVVWFLVKLFVLLFVFVWIRATFPRLRYDQLMMVGWKRMIPLALVWLVVSTVTISVGQFGLPWAGQG
ncbi:MAG: NADH-quinone oxidoreductase subunit NuoH [Actinomycetota bacterium]|nr:NADH-quinone oxidoreductase subunit NuoH [Actinomycetota bacterium]